MFVCMYVCMYVCVSMSVCREVHLVDEASRWWIYRPTVSACVAARRCISLDLERRTVREHIQAASFVNERLDERGAVGPDRMVMMP